MAGLESVRERLAEAAAPLVGGRAFAYMPDQIPVGPDGVFVVVIDPGERVIARLTFARTLEYRLRGRVMVPLLSPEQAQRLLDARISRNGAASVWTAIESIAADGEIEYAEVLGVSGYGESSQGEARFLGAELEIMVVESSP